MKNSTMFAVSAAVLVSAGAQAQMDPMKDGDTMPGMTMPAQPAAAPKATPQAMPGMDMPAPPPAAQDGQVGSMQDMPGMKMGGGDMAGMAGMDMAHMPASLGPYLMNRESSGTSWQPDSSPHQAILIMSGDWSIMFHGMLNGVYVPIPMKPPPRSEKIAPPDSEMMSPLGDGAVLALLVVVSFAAAVKRPGQFSTGACCRR